MNIDTYDLRREEMYRIAIITDIHGNAHALHAVLRDVKEKAVDHIYCLGDMIGIGPFSNEVLSTLFELEHISMITGNHDEAVLALINNEPYPRSRVRVIPHHEWIARGIEKENIAKLEELPRHVTFKMYEKELYFTHYPMSLEHRKAHISEDPFDLTGMPSAENFTCMNDLTGVSIICFGHDHDCHHFSNSSQTFYNPGSLGCYNRPYARYGIIEIDKNGYQIGQQYVPYDFEGYVDSLKRLDFPRKEIVLCIYEKS